MNKLDDSWKGLQKIILYGFGRTAKGSIDYFIDEFDVSAIIDNNFSYKTGTQKYREIPIINLENCNCQDKIIILAAGKALLAIKKSLEESGKTEYRDFVDMDTFFEEWFWRFKGKVHLGKITTSVTTRCNLKCKYCSLFMSYYENPCDYPYDMLCRDADLLFSLVDYISVFVIMGGEPFLYRELKRYLIYIAENYGMGRKQAGMRQAIGKIQLITNGSVLPSADLLEVIRMYDIEVRVSDYSASVPYQKRLSECLTLLKENHIRHVVFEQKEWIDFGFPHDEVNMGETKEILRNHMMKCHGMCQLLHNGRYYYCSSAWSAEECGLYKLESGTDYLELSDLVLEQEKGKVKLLDYYKGNLSGNGHVSFCKCCRGYASPVTVEGGR